MYAKIDESVGDLMDDWIDGHVSLRVERWTERERHTINTELRAYDTVLIYMDKYLYKDEQWMNYTNKQTDRQTERDWKIKRMKIKNKKTTVLSNSSSSATDSLLANTENQYRIPWIKTIQFVLEPDGLKGS